MSHIFNYPYCTFFVMETMGIWVTGLHISFVMETGIWVTTLIGTEEFSESKNRKPTLWVAYLIFHLVALPSVIK